MTTTPTLWKSPYQLNLGFSAGAQGGASAVSFADGRILSVWSDDDNNVDGAPGRDLVGQFRDARGNPLGQAFHVNTLTGFNEGHEWAPRLAALPDGGAIVVFDDDANGTIEVRYLRLDAAGQAIAGGTLGTGDNDYALSDVRVLPGGDILVGFQRAQELSPYPFNNGDPMYARIIDGATFAVGPLLALGSSRNSGITGAFQGATDIAALNNGTFVQVFRSNGLFDIDLVAKIFDQSGHLIRQFTVNADQSATFPRIAALRDGGFVIAWNRTDLGNGDCRVRAYHANGDVAGPVVTLAAGSDQQTVADVIGLADGGFYALHFNVERGLLFGQRFNASGAKIGGANEFAAGDPAASRLALASDGRIIVSYALNGDPMQAIVDPRDNVIWGSDASDTITAQTTGSLINGGDGNDLIHGSADTDFLGGNAGNDIVHGGGGNDVITGGAGFDFIHGEDGNDTIRILSGEQFDYANGGAGIDRLSIASAVAGVTVDLQTGQYRLNVHFPTNYSVIGVEDVSGTANNDRLIGDGNGNGLSGGGGDDAILGGLGNDTIDGGAGKDGLDGDEGNDVIRGGDGNDTLRGDAGNDRLTGGLGGDVLQGNAGNDVFAFNDDSEGNDRIDDWVAAEDQIAIDASAFGGGLVAGALAANRLMVGTAPVANQAFGQFLYNTTNGQLSWDGDGTGGGAAVAITRLLNGGIPVGTLAAADFDILA